MWSSRSNTFFFDNPPSWPGRYRSLRAAAVSGGAPTTREASQRVVIGPSLRTSSATSPSAFRSPARRFVDGSRIRAGRHPRQRHLSRLHPHRHHRRQVDPVSAENDRRRRSDGSRGRGCRCGRLLSVPGFRPVNVCNRLGSRPSTAAVTFTAERPDDRTTRIHRGGRTSHRFQRPPAAQAAKSSCDATPLDAVFVLFRCVKGSQRVPRHRPFFADSLHSGASFDPPKRV